MPLSRANKYFNRIFNRGHAGGGGAFGGLWAGHVANLKKLFGTELSPPTPLTAVL